MIILTQGHSRLQAGATAAHAADSRCRPNFQAIVRILHKTPC